MMKINIMEIYERWLDSVGVNHNYTERMGALSLLLWLKDKDMLK